MGLCGRCSTFNFNRAVFAMIDEQEINASLETTFTDLDTNKDGFLNEAELINTAENPAYYIQTYDLDKNNVLDV